MSGRSEAKIDLGFVDFKVTLDDFSNLVAHCRHGNLVAQCRHDTIAECCG